MYEHRVLQLIAAPENLYAVYENDEGFEFREHVACLALVEERETAGKTLRRIRAITAYGEGHDYFDVVEGCIRFEFDGER